MATNTEAFYRLRALLRENELTEDEHLAKLSGKQYALVEHLRVPSRLHQVSKMAEEGHGGGSRSSLFMLDLMAAHFAPEETLGEV